MAPEMPSKNHTSAPKFDRKAGSLPLFLDDVEQLALTSELTVKQMIQWTIRYAPSSDEYKLWNSLDAAILGASWDDFKTELLALYPGSTGERRYSINDLDMLTEKQASGAITNSKQFGSYYRVFVKISRFLKAKAKLSEREISAQFIHGFDYAFRSQVRAQLRAENPTHHSDDPYDLKQIYDTAIFILSCNHNNSGFNPPSNKDIAPPVKKEHYNISIPSHIHQGTNINYSVLAFELMRHMNIPQVQSAKQPVQQQQAPNFAGQNNSHVPRVRSYDCAFCSDPFHYQYGCPKAAEYMQKGLCMRNNENLIVLPNGTRITPQMLPGRNIMERFDSWHRANPPSPPLAKMSSNFVGSDNEYVWTLPSKNPVSREQNAPGIDDNIVLPTESEIENLRVMENLIASTQKKVDETRRRIANVRQKQRPTTRDMTNMEASSDPIKDPTVSKTITPATNSAPESHFTYTTPIADTKAVNKMIEHTHDSPMAITAEEVLSASPDVRKHIQESTTTTRTTTGALMSENSHVEDNTTSYMASLLPTKDGLVVSEHTQELRALDFTIDGLTVEGVMDEGSQIIGLRKDIWEKLGLPIRSNHVMIMESANKTTNQTIGLIQDLKISIAGYNFYVQVQVVQDAPYELLVGRPFMALTRMLTRHFEDGSSEVTMVDPNSNTVITMPTRARNKRPNTSEINVGFLASNFPTGKQVNTKLRNSATSLTNTNAEINVSSAHVAADTLPNATKILPYNEVAHRTKPVLAMLTEMSEAVKKISSDPPASIPMKTMIHPEFSPVEHPQKRKEQISTSHDRMHLLGGKCVCYAMGIHEEALFNRTDIERRTECFEIIVNPTFEYVPWAFRTGPKPPETIDKGRDVDKQDITCGLYEPFILPYQYQWRCLLKHSDTIWPCVVGNVQALNTVAIDVSVRPLAVKQDTEAIMDRELCHPFVSLHQRSLAIESRDLITVWKHLGTITLASTPSDSDTGSTEIQHRDYQESHDIDDIWILLTWKSTFEVPGRCEGSKMLAHRMSEMVASKSWEDSGTGKVVKLMYYRTRNRIQISSTSLCSHGVSRRPSLGSFRSLGKLHTNTLFASLAI